MKDFAQKQKHNKLRSLIWNYFEIEIASWAQLTKNQTKTCAEIKGSNLFCNYDFMLVLLFIFFNMSLKSFG